VRIGRSTGGIWPVAYGNYIIRAFFHQLPWRYPSFCCVMICRIKSFFGFKLYVMYFELKSRAFGKNGSANLFSGRIDYSLWHLPGRYWNQDQPIRPSVSSYRIWCRHCRTCTLFCFSLEPDGVAGGIINLDLMALEDFLSFLIPGFLMESLGLTRESTLTARESVATGIESLGAELLLLTITCEKVTPVKVKSNRRNDILLTIVFRKQS